MSKLQQTPSPAPGAANNSSWNDSGFAFAPNTNTMDKESMPSDQAQAARDKTAQIMAALKAGDASKANALMGKDQSPGKLLPGMRWVKKKINKRGKQAVVDGEEPVTIVKDGPIADSEDGDGDGGKNVLVK